MERPDPVFFSTCDFKLWMSILFRECCEASDLTPSSLLPLSLDFKYADAKATLKAWHEEVNEVDWENHQLVKSQFRHASILKDSRVVFRAPLCKID